MLISMFIGFYPERRNGGVKVTLCPCSTVIWHLWVLLYFIMSDVHISRLSSITCISTVTTKMENTDFNYYSYLTCSSCLLDS